MQLRHLQQRRQGNSGLVFASKSCPSVEGENSDFYLTPSPKPNLIMGPIVEAKSIKLLEENIRKIIVMFGNAKICQDTKRNES